jgi:hypothetical protein
MVVKQEHQCRNSSSPFTRAQLLSYDIHQLLAIKILPVSDALSSGLLRARIPFDRRTLSIHDAER